MPHARDLGSTKILVAAGLEAIGTTSAGIAFSLGRPDNVFCAEEARLGRREMFVQGTFSYAQDQIPQGELNGIFEQHLLPNKAPLE
ncbi:MAG: isocitrate lyase/phosphoenolpyruvate mutase family protein [Halioglobus sp.]